MADRLQKIQQQWRQKPKKETFIPLNIGAIHADQQRCQQGTVVGVILVDGEVVGQDLLVEQRVHTLHRLE